MCNIVWWWGGRFYLSYMRYTIIRVQVYIYYLIFLLFLMSELLFYPMSVFTWTPPVSDLSSCSQKLSSAFWIIFFGYLFIWSYAWLSGKESTCQCRNHRRPRLDPWVRKIPWRRKWPPTPGFLPGESHGQESLRDYSPWGRTESDPTEMAEHASHLLFSRPVLFTSVNSNHARQCQFKLIRIFFFKFKKS